MTRVRLLPLVVGLVLLVGCQAGRSFLGGYTGSTQDAQATQQAVGAATEQVVVHATRDPWEALGAMLGAVVIAVASLLTGGSVAKNGATAIRAQGQAPPRSG